MKTKKHIIFYIVIFVLLLVMLLIANITKKLNFKNEISSNIYKVQNSVIDVVNEQKVEEYIDDNQVKIGLYVDKGNTKELVTEYFCDFSAENIMGIFYAIPTDEKVVNGDDFKTVFEEYAKEYNTNYKIGYNIKFKLDDGEYVDQTILDPDDAYLMYPEIQFYLYDDINLIPGRPYYHITQDIMSDDRVCSSVKLVGDKRTKNIVSPIELTVFTYDGDDDFTPVTKKYRGNSYHTVLIYEK